MENTENILEVKNLSVSFHTPDGEIEALRDVSFSLKPGETLAVVGESGCGKSVLCRTIMKLIPKNAYIKTGTIQVNNANITDYSQKEMRQLRGALFSMIFQDPMTSLNPTISVGGQIAEAVRIHNKKLPAEQVRKRVIHLMKLVGIENPEERYRLFPHHFSGGMLQRAAIARGAFLPSQDPLCRRTHHLAGRDDSDADSRSSPPDAEKLRDVHDSCHS